MRQYTLQTGLTKDDNTWKYIVPADHLVPPRNANGIFGKFISFSAEKITLQMERMPSNRILHGDDPAAFILVSFATLRFPDTGLRATAEYIGRLMKAGLFLNGVQYRFYHHSNSQLRSRSCFLRRANTDAELDNKIYQLGDFERILNVAKRAKRIGLLFSAAEIDYQLDPRYVTDIADIQQGDVLFSDGCGLMSRQLSIWVSKAKRIVFRGSRYTPCVFQIRYLGYKGVLMLHPELDKEKKHHAQFRKSMKKFTTTTNTTFSVVDYSQPYAFGRLNNDIIVLLSSLGISNEKLIAKQEAYFQWIMLASDNVTTCIDFLSCMGQYPLAERVLLDGLNAPEVTRAVKKMQSSEIASFRNKRDKHRARMMIQKSRLIFGVCDPFKVLREGEVHIRITTSRKGPSTPIHGDVLVVRNPCLHPGDCLKLRAVHNAKLSHLVDCIVFATVARPGHQAAPAMSSGGDLDGDKYFVCWDPDLVPARVSESYDYPPNKEPASRQVSRLDLANHFANYNNSGLAKVAVLHSKWVRSSPKGALSSECQELNALHSQAVDGARVKIPDRLLTPPEPTTPYIIDLLAEAAEEFATRFVQSEDGRASLSSADAADGEALLLRLMQSNQNALSEYELFNLALRLSRKYSFDVRPYLKYLDYGAITTQQKYAISTALSLTPEEEPAMWNSLFRSDLLTARDLYQRQLNQPFSLQRLYSSKIHSLSTFFRYMRMAAQDFTRKLVILKTDERFAVGIFMRGMQKFDEEGDEAEAEDPEVNENAVVCSFMPQASAVMSTYRPCTSGYRIHCSYGNLQLYNKRRADTFIFVTRPPVASGAEIATSIALQKISGRVQQQLGRINRTPVTAIEIHVVSNRDRIAHQLFDLWFEHVPTEEHIGRFDRENTSYQVNTFADVDWSLQPSWLRAYFAPKHTSAETFNLDRRTPLELDQILDFSLKYHAEEEAFWTFNAMISTVPLPYETVMNWLNRCPPLAFTLLKAFPPDEFCSLPDETSPMDHCILRNLIRSANQLGMATLVALEKLSHTINQLSIQLYFDLLMLACHSVRSPQLVQEVLLVLNDCRLPVIESSHAMRYAHKNALGIAFDRAEEAADECPCNEDGKPRRQRVAPTIVKLSFIADKPTLVTAAVRVDARTAVRLHSHVRLQAASKPEKKWIEAPVLDGLVVQASRGELRIELLHPAPPEMDRMDWKMYHAGGIATSKAMMDALLRLMLEGEECCRFCDLITGGNNEVGNGTLAATAPFVTDSSLNPSQAAAVASCDAPLSLIWGPPGTGKTTVVIQILRKVLRDSDNNTKVLMTASTHNAVDNVLERFINMNKNDNLVTEEEILRVATDQSKVNKALQHYTIDSRVGGDMNENNRLLKQAMERVKSSRIIFTTCAGAGLGILRKADFDITIIDEASQITEPVALIPLVKGSRRAVLVGDHVQLRPTVRRMAKTLEFDVSLLERLYTTEDARHIHRTMLNVQYRFPEEIARFPSAEFYQNQLQTNIGDSTTVLRPLSHTAFPWPRNVNGDIIPVVFVQCSVEEDMGGMSKSNAGQADLVAHIVPKLTYQNKNEETEDVQLSVTVLTPYTKQVQAVRNLLPSISCYTVDSFQGRESDIVIFSSVRCNVEGDIGFVEDERRLNVMWTRARLALIIIGDRKTMTEKSGLWARAIQSCTDVGPILSQ